LDRPLNVMTVNVGASRAERAAAVWTSSKRRTRPVADFSLITAASDIGNPNDSVVVAHIYCVPIETPSGVRLQIDYRGSSMAGSDGVVRPGDLVKTYPSLRCCILQSPPGPFEARLDGDRKEAALFRRAAAELFQAGVAVVLTIPQIDSNAHDGLLRLLGDLEATLPRSPKQRLLKLTREFQESIVAIGLPDREAALESAYDVCLYLDPDVRLAPSSPSNEPRSEAV
jgi:hypothetical protein